MQALSWPLAVILLPQILRLPEPAQGEAPNSCVAEAFAARGSRPEAEERPGSRSRRQGDDRESRHRDVFPVDIVCHDLEKVEVTWGPAHRGHAYVDGWNLSLEFRYGDHAPQPCPHYLPLDRDVTSGCLLPMGAGPLNITLRVRGGAKVFSRRRRPSAWLKPRPPWNVRLAWTEADALSVSCPAHRYPGLDYDVQHRDIFDPEWQTTSAPRCNLTVVGLDPERCYDLRLRARPQDFYYGPEARASEWTPVMHWWGAGPAASCAPRPAPPTPSSLPLACGLATLLTLALLLALLRLRRVKEALLPCVPDPRGSFPGLFEKHGGNFQAWIAAAQASAPINAKPEDNEDVIWPQGKWAEPELSPAPPSPGLLGGALVPVGGATFVVDDVGYVTL
ncbi:cytokine receptor-like factor 2 isoform X2 [Arvicanthis niloticus]|uniref:cytokine receptor-like factor 2 isoform X2 n=1 Tax=Arvicanthis niloticus TaxID=61156 RepID=UPI00402BB73B